MKNILLSIFVILLFLNSGSINGQCTPGNEETCPDPENNGQMCPDSLAVGYHNVPYSQEMTILPPATYDFNGNIVELHHVKLHGLDSLPPGLSWESNEVNNEFMAGEYYCVLIDGTPSDSGIYQLYINIEVFVEILNNIVSVGTIQDSSFSMHILPESAGVDDQSAYEFNHVEAAPNPFIRNTAIRFYVPENQQVWMRIYDLTGQCVMQKEISALHGLNQYDLDGSELKSGMYLCTLSDKTKNFSFKIIKR